jgi:hypothetical protein
VSIIPGFTPGKAAFKQPQAGYSRHALEGERSRLRIRAAACGGVYSRRRRLLMFLLDKSVVSDLRRRERANSTTEDLHQVSGRAATT